MTRKIQGWTPEGGLTESGSGTLVKIRGKNRKPRERVEKPFMTFNQALDEHHLYRSPHMGWKQGVKG